MEAQFVTIIIVLLTVYAAKSFSCRQLSNGNVTTIEATTPELAENSTVVRARRAVPDECLKCICKRESGCRARGCNPDAGSLSCGFFQIKLPYYKDCGTPGRRPGEAVENAWKRCADDYGCAKGCVLAYVRRYERGCPRGQSECERAARLHNGGPQGCRSASTQGYWAGIKQCLK